MEKDVYTVIVDGNIIKSINTANGIVAGATDVLGKVQSGPIVTGDRVTFVFEGGLGRIYKLPSFDLVSAFDA